MSELSAQPEVRNMELAATRCWSSNTRRCCVTGLLNCGERSDARPDFGGSEPRIRTPGVRRDQNKGGPPEQRIF